MQQFHRTTQQYPDTRDAQARTQDFSEIYARMEESQAQAQSERCLQCGVPFCQVHCPLHNNIPDWLRYTAEGRLRDAYDMAASTNSFPEICGRICPQDRLCEGHCVVKQDYGAITIGAVEQYITDTAWQEGWIEPFTPTHEYDASIGIIGSGPAGLAAAEQCRRAGLQVHLYDRHPRGGGLLTYGIPSFKLDKAIVLRRLEQYEQSGVVFHQGVDIGRDIGFDELRARHDAVLIATGVYAPRELRAPGNNYRNIVPSLDFLIRNNQVHLGDAPEHGALSAKDQHVVVVGGGDTAMDCVRTAIRQGARDVTCLYRRDRENMPGSAREVGHAMEEGVSFKWLSVPAAFHADGDAVKAVDVQAMRLGAADRSGRRMPEAVVGEISSLPSTMVIKALGFEPEPLPAMFGTPALEVTSRGTLAIDRQMMTSLDGVFAAGDIVRGASLVVWAIADGRDVAQHMLAYIRQSASHAA